MGGWWSVRIVKRVRSLLLCSAECVKLWIHDHEEGA
jgi:hypothetical protein